MVRVEPCRFFRTDHLNMTQFRMCHQRWVILLPDRVLMIPYHRESTALSTTKVVLRSPLGLSRTVSIMKLIPQMLIECKLWALLPVCTQRWLSSSPRGPSWRRRSDHTMWCVTRTQWPSIMGPQRKRLLTPALCSEITVWFQIWMTRLGELVSAFPGRHRDIQCCLL